MKDLDRLFQKAKAEIELETIKKTLQDLMRRKGDIKELVEKVKDFFNGEE